MDDKEIAAHVHDSTRREEKKRDGEGAGKLLEAGHKADIQRERERKERKRI